MIKYFDKLNPLMLNFIASLSVTSFHSIQDNSILWSSQYSSLDRRSSDMKTRSFSLMCNLELFKDIEIIKMQKKTSQNGH